MYDIFMKNEVQNSSAKHNSQLCSLFYNMRRENVFITFLKTKFRKKSFLKKGQASKFATLSIPQSVTPIRAMYGSFEKNCIKYRSTANTVRQS